MKKERDEVSVILLAAGAGRRMGGSIKKQFLEVHGRPLLYYPLHTFEQSEVSEIALVVADEDIVFVREQIVERFGFGKVSKIVCGGAERFLSVYEGLKQVDNPWVLVHDGARACVSAKIIADAIAATKQYQACEVAVPSVDTVKLADEEGFVAHTPDRSLVWAIQTPQGFRTSLLKEAYETLIAGQRLFGLTDDAMVVERAFPDQKIKLVRGEYSNLKVTNQEDLAVVERVLAQY